MTRTTTGRPGHRGPGVADLLEVLAAEIERELGGRTGPGLGPWRPHPGPVRLAFDGGWLWFRVPPAAYPLATLELQPDGVAVLGPDSPRNRVHLGDPRGIARLAGRVVEQAGCRHRDRLARAEAGDDPLVLARSIALRAFLLGFDATRAGNRRGALALAEGCLELLRFDDPADPATGVRTLLYALVAATCRPGDAAAEARARALGLELCPGNPRLGGLSPFVPWQRIVRAVRAASGAPVRRLRTGRDDPAAEELRRVAAGASRLGTWQLSELDYALRCATLEDLARFHTLL